MLRRLVIAHLALLILCGCAASPAQSTSPGPVTRILFIGNSYTFVNDLPGTFISLARSGGHSVETGMAAQGSWTLALHASSTGTLDRLSSSHWDYVVLQEQSEIPALEPARTQEMYPAARSLVRAIQGAGARPIFFLTWAHRDGLPDQGLPDYESMQMQIDQGYMAIAHESRSIVAPVGYAWMTASVQDPRLKLWQADGSHPSVIGTYLAACVFYAVIFNESPSGLTYRDGLRKATAAYLQGVATDTVLGDPSQWNIP